MFASLNGTWKVPFLAVLLTSSLLAQEPTAEPILPTTPVAESPPIEIAKPAAPAETPASEPEAAPDDSPVPIPSLKHFERLWSDSLFTTRALPMPEVQQGPSFVDNFTLSGTYEEKGKMIAILIDKTTSGIVEAYIGEDNDQGFRIAKVDAGESPDKLKLQLQKGNKAGWISFADASAPAAPDGGSIPPMNPGAIMNGQPGGIPQPGAPRPNAAMPPQPTGMPQMPQMMAAPPPVSAPRALPFTEAVNQPPAEAPPASFPGDPPLPPP